MATICASIAHRCQHWQGRGPEVNKFEKVSSDGHHMSLAGGGGFPVERGRLGQGEVGLGESL